MQMICPWNWNSVLTSELPIFVPLGFTFPKVWKCSLMRRNRQTHQCWNDFLGKTIIFYDLAVVTSHKVSNWGNWYKNLHKRSFCFIPKIQHFSFNFFFFCSTDEKGQQLLYLTHATTTSSSNVRNYQ